MYLSSRKTWIEKYLLLAVRGRAETSKANDAINGDLVQEHKEKIQELFKGGGVDPSPVQGSILLFRQK